MKILIVGAGGIGGFFGARLIQVGADVTYLLRDKRKALIDAKGLNIHTPTQSFTVHPKTISAKELTPIYDLIILACKAYDLDDVIQSVQGASVRGCILPFLNGLAHMDKLDSVFGAERVLGGVAMLPTSILSDGSVRQFLPLNKMIVGARPGHAHAQELAQSFLSICQTAAFDSALSANIVQSLWDKWVSLASMAAMTTLTRANIGEIMQTQFGNELMSKIYHTCCEVAKAEGFPVSLDAQQNARSILTLKDSTASASMLRDLLSNQKTEHENVLGEMIRRAVSHAIECDVLKLAYTHLQITQGKLPVV
jgi:2-dehydropantoate 2-reductase